MVYMIPSECGSVHISEAGRPIQARIREQERDIRLTCTLAIPLMNVKIHLLLFNWQIVNNIPSLNKNALIRVLSKVFFRLHFNCAVLPVTSSSRANFANTSRFIVFL